jgi:hypothetical protein
MEATSLDGQKTYSIDVNGDLLDKSTGKIVAHLIPGGAYLPTENQRQGRRCFSAKRTTPALGR